MRAIDTLLADRGQLFQALFLSAPDPQGAGRPRRARAGREPDDVRADRPDRRGAGRPPRRPARPPRRPAGRRPRPRARARRAALDPNLLLDGERRLRRSDGTELWVVQSHEVVRHNNGEPQFVVLSLVDVTDRRRAEDDLVRRAFTDPLTGLPNRRALTDRLRHAVALSRRRGLQVGLVHLNIDRFKAVNEALGHEAGDLLLSQVADRLRWSTRVEDTAVRLGADEFLVVAEDVEDLDGLRALADRLLSVLDEPFLVHEREINLSASVGLTLGSDMTPDDLLRQAQSALTKAKADGSRARIEVHEGALAHERRRRAAAGDRPAARAGQRGAAALLPADRAPGRRDAARLRGAGPLAAPDPRAAARRRPSSTPPRTTGSPPSSAPGCCTAPAPTPPPGPTTCACTSTSPPGTWPRTGFSELVADALEESGLAPRAAGAGDHRVDGAVRRRGHAALGRRRHRRRASPSPSTTSAPATRRSPRCTGCRSTRVKIDRSFVADVVTEPATAALVQGLLQLGRGMGLQVIAEGIEDLDQAAWLLRPRLRDGPGLRVRPARAAAQPGRGAHGRAARRPRRDRRRRADGRPAAAPAARGAGATVDPELLANGDYETGPMTGEFALAGDATGELFDELADEPDED